MPRSLTPEELEIVRETEALAAAEAAKRSRTAMQATEGHLKLYHPKIDALKFGTVSELKNGPETTDDMIVFGGLEPGVAIVREGHPLLQKLLRRHPSIVVMEPGEVPGRLYACPDCDDEFKTKRALKAHAKAHAAPRRPAQADATA
jgi:hypothetical protein